MRACSPTPLRARRIRPAQRRCGRIRTRPSATGKVLGHVDSLSADFSLLAALRGKADFHEFHFLRPVLYLRRDEGGLIDWTNEGLLANAIEGAQDSAGTAAMRPDQDATIGDRQGAGPCGQSFGGLLAACRLARQGGFP